MFYKNPEVTRVTLAISLSIFLTSLSVQHLALLKRAMRFSKVSINDIIARCVSVATSIGFALAGWGYWALVIGVVAQPLSSALGAWYLCKWAPGLPGRANGTASSLRFAVHVYARFTVNYCARNLDNLLVGWRFDAVALGFYKKAYDLFALSGSQLVAPLGIVAVSALRRYDARSREYRHYLLNALAVIALVGMGLGADLTLIGRDLIRLLLGPRWDQAGTIFTYFGPGIGIMLVYYTHGWIHLSIGRADRWFRWGIFEFIFTALLFVIGLPHGPDGIAIAWTASFWILVIPAFWYAGRPIQLGVGPLLAAIWRSVVASIVASIATFYIIRHIPFGFVHGQALEAFVRVISVSILFLSLYSVSVVLIHGGLTPLEQVANLIREMVPWRVADRPSLVPDLTPVAQEPLGEILRDAQMHPLVSILIPAHNAEPWIADTLRSAIAQTWPNMEIIVVEDGSSDQTLAVAKRFESDVVHVYSQKNLGAAAARNLAFSLSKGDYIQWLDADDILAVDKIATQMELNLQLKSKKTLLSAAWGQFMHRPYRAHFIPTALWSDLTPVEWLLRKMGQNLYMQTATWLVPRELAEAVGPWDTRLLSDDDGEYFCRVLLASDGVRFVPGSRVYYRGPGLAFRSLSFIGRSTRKIQAHWVSMQLHIRYLRSLEESARVQEACLHYLQTSVGTFYPDNPDILKQAEQLAGELGGKLTPPHLSWKYYWMKSLFGWRAARLGQLGLLRLRWGAQRLFDELAYRIETSMLGMSFHGKDLTLSGRPFTSQKREGAGTGIVTAPKADEKISGA